MKAKEFNPWVPIGLAAGVTALLGWTLTLLILFGCVVR